MKQNNEIDQMIKEALSQEEQELFNSYEEQDMFGMIGGLFQGKMKWLNAITVVIQIALVGFAVYFGYKFFTAESMLEMVRFGGIFFTLLIAMTTLKIFHMMEMNKNSITREIKRVELQVSVLAGKLAPK